LSSCPVRKNLIPRNRCYDRLYLTLCFPLLHSQLPTALEALPVAEKSAFLDLCYWTATPLSVFAASANPEVCLTLRRPTQYLSFNASSTLDYSKIRHLNSPRKITSFGGFSVPLLPWAPPDGNKCHHGSNPRTDCRAAPGAVVLSKLTATRVLRLAVLRHRRRPAADHSSYVATSGGPTALRPRRSMALIYATSPARLRGSGMKVSGTLMCVLLEIK
jgi:hypothetical protein